MLAGHLPAEMVRRRLEREGVSTRGGSSGCLRRLRGRYELDLLGFLNGATVHELRALAASLGMRGESAGALRQRLWLWGAALERHGLGDAAAAAQLAPVLAAGRLSLGRARAAASEPLPAARDARFPPSPAWPRPVPEVRRPPPPAAEPDDLEELLGRADALVGVRLGARGVDKGEYGRRISELLGIAASSSPKPDWRGAVEVKSVAVVRAGGACWRLKDGPAIAMRSVNAPAKLARVLWMVRVDEGEVPGAPVLSWFYQELDVDLARALERARHLRPKGGAGTRARGWYLRRDFFEACGLLASLNGRAS